MWLYHIPTWFGSEHGNTTLVVGLKDFYTSLPTLTILRESINTKSNISKLMTFLLELFNIFRKARKDTLFNFSVNCFKQ